MVTPWLKPDPFSRIDVLHVFAIPGSSQICKFLPFSTVVFFLGGGGEKAHILHTSKIQVSINISFLSLSSRRALVTAMLSTAFIGFSFFPTASCSRRAFATWMLSKAFTLLPPRRPQKCEAFENLCSLLKVGLQQAQLDRLAPCAKKIKLASAKVAKALESATFSASSAAFTDVGA